MGAKKKPKKKPVKKQVRNVGLPWPPTSTAPVSTSRTDPRAPLSTRSLSLPPPRPQAKAQSDDSELFYHEGTKGFTGDPNAFVYKIGLSQ